MRLNLYLAWRLLVARKASLFFMLAAVAFGLGFQWPNMANISGYSREMLVRFVEKGLGHYRIFHEEKTFFDARAAREQLNRERDAVRIDPRIRRNGLVTRVGRRRLAAGVVVLGVDRPEWEAILAGAARADEEPAALVGAQLAERLKFKPGEKIKVLVMKGGRPYFRNIRPVVVTGYGYVTERQIILPLSDLQKMLGVGRRITELAVLREKAPMPGDRIFAPSPPYKMRAWWVTIDFARRAIEGNQVLALIASIMTLTGVSIPLLALLYVAVIQDREHIALLSSLGFSRLRLFLIYFMRSAFIATLGCAGGAGIGYGLIRYFTYEPIYQTSAFVIRPDLSLEDLIRSIAVVFGVTLLSGVYPALRAARLDPVVIFRGIKE